MSCDQSSQNKKTNPPKNNHLRTRTHITLVYFVDLWNPRCCLLCYLDMSFFLWLIDDRPSTLRLPLTPMDIVPAANRYYPSTPTHARTYFYPWCWRLYTGSYKLALLVSLLLPFLFFRVYIYIFFLTLCYGCLLVNIFFFIPSFIIHHHQPISPPFWILAYLPTTTATDGAGCRRCQYVSAKGDDSRHPWTTPRPPPFINKEKQKAANHHMLIVMIPLRSFRDVHIYYLCCVFFLSLLLCSSWS